MRRIVIVPPLHVEDLHGIKVSFHQYPEKSNARKALVNDSSQHKITPASGEQEQSTVVSTLGDQMPAFSERDVAAVESNIGNQLPVYTTVNKN